MQAVARISGLKRFIEKRDADPLDASPLPKRSGNPRLALEHFGKQAELNRDDLAVPGQPGDRLVEESVLLGREGGRIAGQPPESSTERDQDPARVRGIE